VLVSKDFQIVWHYEGSILGTYYALILVHN